MLFLFTILLSILSYGQSIPTVISITKSSNVDTLSHTKIKSIKVSEFEGREVFGDIVKSKLKSSSTKIYDTKGNVLKEYVDDIIKFSNKYDYYNNVIEIIYYDKTGKYEWKYINKYDDNNNKIEEKIYSKTGNIGEINIWKYDNSGKLIREYCFFAAKESIKGNRTYLFDENNAVMMKNPFNGVVGILSDYKIYIYNSQGFLNEKSTYRFDVNNFLFHKIENKEKYRYDNFNNLIMITLYDSKGSLRSEKRKRYNSENKVIESVSYDSYGSLSHKTIYTYNDQRQETSRISYGSNGIKNEESIYYYNSLGELSEESYYVSFESIFENSRTKYYNGRVIEKIDFDKYNMPNYKLSYKYDSNGLITETVVDSSNIDLRMILTCEYKFDQYGNSIVSTQISKRNDIIFNITILEKSIVYY